MSLASKDNDRSAEYYFGQMNSAIQSSLSSEQRRELLRILQRAVRTPSKKVVSWELRFWLIKRFYLVFYLGFDQRKKRRVNLENAPALIKLCSHSAVRLALFIATSYVFLTVIYYTKSVLGIDIIPDKHFSGFFW